ncbi:amidohydrolase [Nakamurella deserti]|uniref:amidohydrolase n=1 Tax=Nakamurella deserti TaxID=2164074 RepID=UPI000DBE6651|nr:amidohydrolase family protein [Nakamurella deserti]
MTTTLLRGGRIHNPAEPAATCLAITDGVVSWIGPDTGVEQAGHIDETIDLDGLFVAPAFVDAHVHCTDAGLALIGLDLRGARSLTQALDLLRAHAASSDAGLIWGHGWDDAGWPERRPPSRSEIDAAVGGRPTYLSRIDVHSAVVSGAIGDRLDTARPGFSPDGPLTQDSHHEARGLARSLLSDADRTAAQRAFLTHAASRGMVEVHECAFSDPQALADLAGLLALDAPVAVRAYLGQAVTDPAEATALLARTGAHALGGDLSVDGALGSRTASLHAPYADHAGTGVRYLSDDQIADHLVACARAGIQPGFHAIGDDAVAAVAGGLRRAAEILGGTLPLAAVAPRIEHAEMISAADIDILSRCGAIASVQPLFDALWGGTDGVYVQRLGVDRAAPMNPFAAIAAAGVTLAFGSDAPVTAAEPWQAVRAAVNHRTPGSSVTPRAAFTAHTRGAHRAARRLDRGVLTVGSVADLAIWETGPLVRPEAAELAQRWSTDPRSRVPLLPDLAPHAPDPVCVATVAAGRVAFDTGLLVSSSLPR